METYVLVHGVNQGGWIWKNVARYLRAEGHEVHTPTMDGCAERRHQLRLEITLNSQVAELLEYLFYYDLNDIMLVGTSSSGIHVSKMADAAPERVKHLFYVDALLPLPGETRSQLIVKEPDDAFIREELGWMPKPERLRKYNVFQCDPETNDWAADRFTLWPTNVSIDVGGWSESESTSFWSKSWPATVINGVRSKNPATSHVKEYAEKLKARYLEMDAGHWPMVSHPEELARLLMS